MTAARKTEDPMTTLQETTLAVDGMSCGSCVRHIDHALRAITGVKGIDVKLREGRVVVRHDTAAAPIAALIETLADAGYEARAA